MGAAPSGRLLEELRDQHAAMVIEAARSIATADVLLLCTGAGFSADSGLAVYADVARVPAYAQRRLKYHDICQPCWLRQEPELFWGFWGQCFNDYRNTTPHEGYSIISAWADKHFRHSSFADAVRQRWRTLMQSSAYQRHRKDVTDGLAVPYDVGGDAPGAFFAFTSNVDAHHFDWFAASEIRECHGNTELYQCTSRYCQRKGAIWRAPLSFRFQVDKTTMLARNGSPAASRMILSPCVVCEGTRMLLDSTCPLCDGIGAFADEDEEISPGMPAGDVPRIGQVGGGGRPTVLRYMPGPAPEAQVAGFTQNHPVCPHCNAAARPAILMFGDCGWQDFDEQEERWERWRLAVKEEIKSRSGQVRVVILELGAGCNVPTVRCTSEDKLRLWHDAGAVARLVRINADMPLGDRPPFSPGSSLASSVISIMARGLPTLLEINAIMLNQSFERPVAETTLPSQQHCASGPPWSGDLSAEGLSEEEWLDIKTAFEAQAQGKQALPLEVVYKVIVPSEGMIEYSYDDFQDNIRTLKKVGGREDPASAGELTLTEVRQFFEMFG